MATEACPPFLANTGRLDVEALSDVEALEATRRFANAAREASGDQVSPDVARCAELAVRAFGGDAGAWAPLVEAVRDLLGRSNSAARGARRARRELRAFVSENADLLER